MAENNTVRVWLWDKGRNLLDTIERAKDES